MAITRDVQRWLTHLTEVSGSLTRSLDYDTTLHEVVRLPIPALADWCMVYVPDDGGAIPARLAVAHASATKEALLRTIWQPEWLTLPSEHPIMQTLRQRAPVVVNELDSDGIQRLCAAPEHAHVLQRVGIQSLLTLPLVAHGTLIGAAMLVLSGTRRRTYDETSSSALIKLGECYAQAIYNARLFIECRQAARLRDEVIAGARQDLIELVSGVRHHPRSLRGEIERIASRLDMLVEPYGRH